MSEKEINPASDKNELASRGKRLSAVIVDIFIFLPLVLLVARPLGLIEISENETIEPIGMEQKVKLFITGQLIFLLVQGYFLHSRGQTIGKILLKIRIVNQNDDLLGIGKLYFLRYFLFNLAAQIPIVGWILALVNILFIFGKDQRCLHDRIVGSKVINIC